MQSYYQWSEDDRCRGMLLDVKYVFQIPSEVYLLSHLRGKKHQQAIADNHTGRELTRQEIVSWL